MYPRSVLVALAVSTATLVFPVSGAKAMEQENNSGCILDRCADSHRPVFRRTGGSDRTGSGERFRGYSDDSGMRARPRGASNPGDFDFYVLSLSWSPGFCATGGAQKGKAQCEPGQNKDRSSSSPGFVVHGLWPQYERGFPQDCGRGQQPSRMVIDAAAGIFPDEGLARYEWRKHGTCAGSSPADYFSDVRRARDMIAIPPQFRDSRSQQSLAPADILRAFEAANPRLRPGMAAVGCRSGIFQEVRFCMSKDLRNFRPCAEVVRQSCRTRDIAVPAQL